MAIFMPAFQILGGINSILFYAPVLFQSMGFGSNASLLSSVLTGGVLCGSTVISIVLVDKVGRRKLLITGGIQMIICQVHIYIYIHSSFLSCQKINDKNNRSEVMVLCIVWISPYYGSIFMFLKCKQSI